MPPPSPSIASLPAKGLQSLRRRASLPIPGLLPIAWLPVGHPVAGLVADPVEPKVVTLVESGSKAPSTGPEVTPLVLGRWSFSSGLVYARASPGQARVLGLELLLRHRFWALNPDPV